MVGIAEQVQATGRILRARLYEGSITYGEAARIRYEAVQQAQRALQEVAAAERQRAQTAAYQQQMANAASSAALINAGQTLLLLQQQNVLLQQSLGVNRFTQTQCRVFGNRIDCTTF
jgi:archaellum component FlaF (FlaF/FlaG flagellin family)